MKRKILSIAVLAVSMTVSVAASAQVLYPSSEYPTAQGKYLQAPSAPAPVVAPLSAPVNVPVSPQPAPSFVLPAEYPPAPVAAAPAAVAPVAAPVTAPATPRASAPAQPTSYGSLPSYSYDKSMDPANPTYKTPIAHDASATGSAKKFGLGTLQGFEGGIQISDYRYQEFAPDGSEFIHITGASFGLTFDSMKVYSNGWFWGGDFRGTYGSHDYTGGDIDLQTGVTTPSTKSGISDWMFDTRVLGGHDFTVTDAFWGLTSVGLSPYSGLGFRYLYDDDEGADSNGVPGYERFSHYTYIPLGLTSRFHLTENSRLDLNLEYDYMFYGWQTSALGESIDGASDMINYQHNSWGLRGSAMYERPTWSVGPFFEFWDIEQSGTDCESTGTGVFCGDEPHNQTIEFGIQARYRFLNG